jgi:exo-beta-1,3-glucanase (GH17 family)
MSKPFNKSTKIPPIALPEYGDYIILHYHEYFDNNPLFDTEEFCLKIEFLRIAPIKG